jgi:hypothetical protein
MRIQLFTLMLIRIASDFSLDVVPDPVPHQSDANLEHRLSNHPLVHCEPHASFLSLYGSRLSFYGVILSLHAPQFRP